MTAEASPGTLTFLFADLESSTKLWERFPDAMRAAMERHDAILRTAVEQARGVVVKTTGDGLMASFASACDAVLAALAAQRGLATEQWSETGPLRARIGLHSGEAQAREGDYFGPPVYRTARIMAAAHGGQVLLSGMTAMLARDCGLPPGATLRDLGEHRLKDLLQPEHIFQVDQHDLPAEFPPLTTLARSPHNLPIQASELIGREHEVRAIRDHIESGTVRLLTLTGPGGIGKTRLALQAAADQIDRFADGVYFIDLSSARDAEAALGAIVRTVGLKAAGGARLEDVLKDQLHDRRILLVLDNFEQVMAAADAVADLLQHAAGLRIMVTSREALRVRGEQLLPIAPLALPASSGRRVSAASVAGSEAVRLFTDRARAARPDFVLTDANAAAVAEVCTRLDGLPLAIELAAARLKLFSPEDLRERLRHRLEVLRGGARDLPARQQTLRSTIEWSYELLGEDERAVFQLLAVFADARIEAVEEVASRTAAIGEIDVIDRLSSLVDKSLVRSVEGARGQRLAMLETIREYAAERLGENPALGDAARRAHADYFAAFAGSKRAALESAERDAAIADLAADLGNLQVAWRYWLAEGHLARLQTLLDALWVLNEARGWYHDAIALASDLLDVLATTPASPARMAEELTLRMSVARGLLAVRGYTEEVEQVYRAALELAQSAGELPQRLPVLRSLANFYLYRGEIDKTLAMGRQMLELGEREGDTWLQIEGNFVVGVTTAFSGDVPLGQQHMTAAMALFDPRRHGPTRLRLGPSVSITARTTSALIHWITGQADSAERQADDAIDLAGRLSHPYSAAYAHFHVGLLKAMSGRFDEAAVHADKVFDIAGEHDYAIWRALACVLRGLAMARRGQAAAGLVESEEGLVQYQGLTTPPIFWSSILALHADTTALAGDHQRAIELIDEALAISNELDLRTPLLIVQKGELLAAARRRAEADEWLRRGVESARHVGTRMAQLRAATALVRLGAGEAANDVAALRDTLAQFSEGFDSPDLLAAWEVLDANP